MPCSPRRRRGDALTGPVFQPWPRRLGAAVCARRTGARHAGLHRLPVRGSSRRYDFAVFIPSVVASGALTIAATMLAPSVPTRAGLILILGFAVIMRLLVISDEPFLSTDIYRYIWDGRVQAAGINPYALRARRSGPCRPARRRHLPQHQSRRLCRHRLSAGGPGVLPRSHAHRRESLAMMRLAMVACEAVIVVVLIDLLRQLRQPATAVVAWAWHPLAIWEIAGSGHVDALMVALLMLGVLAAACASAPRRGGPGDAGGAGQSPTPSWRCRLLAAVGLAGAARRHGHDRRCATCPISASAAACSAS